MANKPALLSPMGSKLVFAFAVFCALRLTLFVLAPQAQAEINVICFLGASTIASIQYGPKVLKRRLLVSVGLGVLGFGIAMVIVGTILPARLPVVVPLAFMVTCLLIIVTSVATVRTETRPPA